MIISHLIIVVVLEIVRLCFIHHGFGGVILLCCFGGVLLWCCFGGGGVINILVYCGDGYSLGL
jgi:hypothetical protein